MQSEAENWILRETGGILLGYWGESHRDIVITHCTGPGPGAHHGFNYFEADNDFCQQELNRIFRDFFGYVSYLGDWHTHPWGSVSPSFPDFETMKKVAADLEIGVHVPLLLIFRQRLLRKVSLGSFLMIEDKFYRTSFHLINSDDVLPYLHGICTDAVVSS